MALTVALVWALRPVSVPTPGRPNGDLVKQEMRLDTEDPQQGERGLDLAVFDVDLWNAPGPSPIAAAEAEPPQPPPNLQLIAIVTENSRYLAALYDSDSDRLHIAGAGESIGSLEIIAVDAGGVELRGGSTQFRLTISTLASVVGDSVDEVVLARHDGDEP